MNIKIGDMFRIPGTSSFMIVSGFIYHGGEGTLVVDQYGFRHSAQCVNEWIVR